MKRLVETKDLLRCRLSAASRLYATGDDPRSRLDRTVYDRDLSRDYGSWVEVTGGVARGATIVLNPPDGLQAGQRVRALPSAATSGG